MPPVDILANTVLPAIRSDVGLDTADGERLVGALAVPADRPPLATAVCLHPLPLQGGSMDSHLLRKMARRLPALAGIAVLRFNTRGTDGSSGTFDGGVAERFDLAAALDLVADRELPAPWLVGWSFGTDVTLRHGLDPDVVGAVLISPPLKQATDADLDRWAADGRPLVAIVPERDDYLQPPAARERFARVPQARVLDVPGAKHLFVGYTETVLDAIADALVPGSAPLPRTWDGPVADDGPPGPA